MFLKNKLVSNSIDILPELNSSSDFKTIDKEYQKILRDLLVILSTLRGSILYKPKYGGNLYGFMWDQLTPHTLSEIEELVSQSLSYSDYLVVKEIKVSTVDSKTAKVLIELVVDDETRLKVALNLSPLGEIEISDAEQIISKFIVSDQ